jgi:3-isopropylmalate dehydrogenase
MKSFDSALTGACAIDAVGVPYPDETHEICMKADAVLFGAITQNTITTQQQSKTRTRVITNAKIRFIC